MRLGTDDDCWLFVLSASFFWHSDGFLASTVQLVFCYNAFLVLGVLHEDEDFHNGLYDDDTHLRYALQETRHTAFFCFSLFCANYCTHFLRLQACGTSEGLETHDDVHG